MGQNKTIMIDCPSKHTMANGIGYNILLFVIFPFVLFLMMQGSFSNLSVVSIAEMAYHIVNFLAAAFIFMEYLRDSFLNVQINPKAFWSVVLKSSLLILAISVVLFYAAVHLLKEHAALGAYGIIPLFEMNLFFVPSYFVEYNPVMGTIWAVLLAPLTVSCLYYAAVFAPIANNRPVLAYFVTAAYIALPRAWNSLGFLIPEESMVLYAVQLPVHLLACRAYQKTDTVWAPIAVLTIVNTVASAALLIMQAMA